MCDWIYQQTQEIDNHFLSIDVLNLTEASGIQGQEVWNIRFSSSSNNNNNTIGKQLEALQSIRRRANVILLL